MTLKGTGKSSGHLANIFLHHSSQCSPGSQTPPPLPPASAQPLEPNIKAFSQQRIYFHPSQGGCSGLLPHCELDDYNHIDESLSVSFSTSSIDFPESQVYTTPHVLINFPVAPALPLNTGLQVPRIYCLQGSRWNQIKQPNEPNEHLL